MANSKSYSILKGANASFNAMLRHFGVVDVMDAKVYEVKENLLDGTHKVDEIFSEYNKETPLVTLNTLKIANITQEGPTKTITGGRNNNVLLKFGKTARLEMQDALGNVEAFECLSGAVIEHFGDEVHNEHNSGSSDVLHIGTRFASPKTIIGDMVLIDQKTGQAIKAKIILFRFSPDSLFNLTQDAEGDAAVFDMNGDLLATDIYVGTGDTPTDQGIAFSDFYAILSEKMDTEPDVIYEAGKEYKAVVVNAAAPTEPDDVKNYNKYLGMIVIFNDGNKFVQRKSKSITLENIPSA